MDPIENRVGSPTHKRIQHVFPMHAGNPWLTIVPVFKPFKKICVLKYNLI